MAIKSAMILAAGRGERMRPLTDTLPKPLLQVHNKALIEYHIEGLVKTGCQRIVINHAWLGDKIVEALGDGKRYGVNLLYSKEFSALETAGGIIQALPLLCQRSDEQEFTVVNGDVFTDFDFDDLPPVLTQSDAHLVMVDNPEHNPQGDFSLSDGQLAEGGEAKFTFSGIARYSRRFFAEQTQGIKPLAPMLRHAMQQGCVTGQLHKGQWTDVGTPERLAKLNSIPSNALS